MGTIDFTCSKKKEVLERFECVNLAIDSQLTQKPPAKPQSHSLSSSINLLSALGGGTSYYGEVEYSQALKDWMLTQEDKTVELPALFSQAYNLCDRDVYCSLLSAYNVLVEGSHDKNRRSLPIQKKLATMRRMDNFGAYYHYMGATLSVVALGSATSRLSLDYFHHAKLDANDWNYDKADVFEDKIDWLGYDLGKIMARHLSAPPTDSPSTTDSTVPADDGPDTAE